MLDTDTCSDVLRHRYSVAEKMRDISPMLVNVSAITIAEAWSGALKRRNSAHLLSAWNHFLQPFSNRILPFDKGAAEHYGDIRSTLETRGEMIGDRDCMIAAIARHHGLAVVTANSNEFQRVPDLVVENWRDPSRP